MKQRLMIMLTFPWMENAEPLKGLLEKNKDNPKFWAGFMSKGGYDVSISVHSKEIKHDDKP